MYSLTKWSIFLVLLVIKSAWAAADDDSLAPELAAESTPVEWRTPAGKFSQTGLMYPQRITDLPTLQGLTEAELEFGVSKGDWSARMTPVLRMWEPEMVAGRPHRTRPSFDMRDGYLERSGETIDVRAGNQIVTWGAADSINPTDVWNPSDLADPLVSTKLSQALLKAKIHPSEYESFQLELVATPLFRETRLPIDYPDSGTRAISKTSSRWLLLPNRVTAGGQTFPLQYEVGSRDYAKTWQAGARLQFLRFWGWDFSLSYFNGVEKIPRFAVAKQGIATDPSLPFLVTLYPSFHRTQQVGVDGAGSLTIGELELGTRFEIAYILPNNSRLSQFPSEFNDDLYKDRVIYGVAGGDYTFQKRFFGTVVYLNAQYVHYQTLEKKQRNTPGPTVVSGLPNLAPFDRNAVFFIEDRMGKFWKLRLVHVLSFQNRDGILSPNLHYQYSDSLKFSVGGDLFLGNKKGFYGQFEDNRRLKSEISYVF